ncbi:hypothetical protein GCM10022221_45280 [Actinocorallia aurea]
MNESPQTPSGPYNPSAAYSPTPGYAPPPGYTPPPWQQQGPAPAAAAPPKQRAPLYVACTALGVALVALATSVTALVTGSDGTTASPPAAAPSATATATALHKVKMPDVFQGLDKTTKWANDDVQKAIKAVTGSGETGAGSVFVDNDAAPRRIVAIETVYSPKPFDSIEAKVNAVVSEAMLPVGSTVDIEQTEHQQQDPGPLGGTLTCWTVTVTDNTSGAEVTRAVPACVWATANVIGIMMEIRTVGATDVAAVAEMTRQFRHTNETVG